MTDITEAASVTNVWPPVLAVDPGSTETGLCLRVGTEALEAVTVEREAGDGHHAEAVNYGRRVLQTMSELSERNRAQINLEAKDRGVQPGVLRRAAESLVAPTARPVKGRRSSVAPRVLKGLPGAATVLGMVVGTWPKAILVPPHGEPGWDAVGNAAAPPTLKGRTPSGWMTGGQTRSHQRSAWAIAGAAHVMKANPIRVQAQSATAWALQQDPATNTVELVKLMRSAIQRTEAWDLLDRLPSLAYSVISTAMQDPQAGQDALDDVTTYLTEQSTAA